MLELVFTSIAAEFISAPSRTFLTPPLHLVIESLWMCVSQPGLGNSKSAPGVHCFNHLEKIRPVHRSSGSLLVCVDERK